MFVKLTKWDEVFFSFTTFEINDQNESLIGIFEPEYFGSFFLFEN